MAIRVVDKILKVSLEKTRLEKAAHSLILSLASAVLYVLLRQITNVRLENRGILLPGFYADVNVFALDELKINATFSNPRQYCTGMDYVLVNGVPVIEKGKYTGAKAGRVLRHLPKK